MSIGASSNLGPARPFPGLRPFEYADHSYFFGRDDQKYALYRMVDRSRFITAVGSSGSGKSSLVFAGLCPLLDKESRDAGGRNWTWRAMSPGSSPLDRLIELLVRPAGVPRDGSTNDVLSQPQYARISYLIRNSSSRGLVQALAEIESLRGKTLLLIVDQFEELFRYSFAAQGSERDKELLGREEATLFVRLLLEVGRSADCNVRIMLTMRSDFIGDCARFRGLPEAVSEVQFLVPSLTRGQREEVIRKPIEKAKALIDPKLVEHLLNDNNDDMDQLPVLQHCLLRLWDQAGRDMSTANANSPRRLTLDHYQAIGRMEGALSQHADEILRGLPGLEFAVQLVFRALADFDKDARVIRRALPFKQLLAETGLPKADLRKVLDRFRAVDCSFLRPAPPRELEDDDTSIDVGHEALLRRWERVSGRPGALATEETAEAGWLATEKRDGERYRFLLARATADGDLLPFRQVKQRLEWWATPGRTKAWAERYGGGFAQVRRLLQRSRNARRIQSVAIVVGIVVIYGAVAVGYKLYQNAQVERHMAAERENEMHHQRHMAEQNHQWAIRSANEFLQRVLDSFNNGSVSVKGADEFMEVAEGVLRKSPTGGDRAPETIKLEADLRTVSSDILVARGQHDEALTKARAACELIEPLLKREPTDPRWLATAYACTFRIADVFSDVERSKEPSNLKYALNVYGDALAYAQKLTESQPGNASHQLNVAFIRGKLGDVRLMLKNYPGAHQEYNAALKIVRQLVDAAPDRVDAAPDKNALRRDLASTLMRFGWVLDGERKFDDSLQQFRAALVIRRELAEKDPDNNIYQSHIAESHRSIGDALRRLGRPDEALAEYQMSLIAWESLLRKDAQHARWLIGAAKTRASIAETQKGMGDLVNALDNYGKAFAKWDDLAARDRTRQDWQERAASSGEAYGALLRNDERLLDLIDVYRDIVAARKALAEVRQNSIEDKRRLFKAYLGLGDLLLAANANYRDSAIEQYREANSIALRVAASNPSDVAWQQDAAIVRDKLARLASGAVPIKAEETGATGRR
jgi:tetratricopeptide (TPR) repeat protein